MRPPTLPDYWAEIADLPRTEVQLFGPRDTPTRKMTAVERATVRVTLDDGWTPGKSIVHEAALRMTIWDERGLLDYMSGQYIAHELQRVFWYPHPSSRAHRGWDLMRAVDAADVGVEITFSTLTHSSDRYERVRLGTFQPARLTG